MRISREVMSGFSTLEEVRTDMLGIERALLREKIWYAKAKRFSDSTAIETGILAGELVIVLPNDNIQPIRRFRNPHLHVVYPPYLTPNALEGYEGLGRAWRLAADTLGISKTIKLAATSFVRSQEYQDRLVAAGKFAVPDSTHVVGASFDIDLGGYSYWDIEADREVVVSLREPSEQRAIAGAFKRDLGTKNADEPIRLGPEHFDERVPACLMYVVERLYANGRLNFVGEMLNTVNRVLHITPAPPEIN